MAKKSKETHETQVDDWEVKDRTYYLNSHHTPVTYTIPSRHTRKHPLLYFDAEKKEQRALRYATNQPSPFEDEQKGEATLEHIVFKDGTLFVPKEKVNLQKLLSLYHPRKGKDYNEYNAVNEAKDDLVDLEMEIMALNAAREIEVGHAEAILRVEVGSKVANMSSKEIRRDILRLAKRNPRLFISLVQDDNVELRNFAIKATEQHIVKLSQDQRYFMWGSNDRKLMTIPFDENPYSALAAWFKTDEGVEVYKTIEKKII
ncbi:MAG: hypothetical protein HRT86_05545 [Ilumatobacteraceae bacterium]|nr:hypothetical protein [Ilumatobacteraceae bacterium]